MRKERSIVLRVDSILKLQLTGIIVMILQDV